MYKYNNNSLPTSFNNYFSPVDNIYSHNTRNKKFKLFIPRVNKKLGQKSISFLGSKCWNKIPKKIKNLKYLNTFTKQLKNHLLEAYRSTS